MMPLSPALGMLQLALVLLLGASLELLCARQLQAYAERRRSLAWGWATLGAPLLRGSVIISAVLWAYPALFGLRAAPPLASLLENSGAQRVTLLAAIVLLRVPAAAVRWLNTLPGVVDSVQGLLAVAVLFVAFADYLGALSTTAWPGIVAALALAGMSLLVPALASGLGRDVAARWSLAVGECCAQILGMLALAPLLVLYGYLLGLQLSV